MDNAYLPLVRVASDYGDSSRGTDAAIKGLALRCHAVDHAAARRMLSANILVARPFLIPPSCGWRIASKTHDDSVGPAETTLSAFERQAHVKAQSSIHVVPALKSLNLGDPLHSTKSFRARTTGVTPGSTIPYVEITKYFFPRRLVIQAKVIPYASGGVGLVFTPESVDKQNVLSDVSLIVAESSEEEAIQPMLQVPIQLLPPKLRGSAWCVLSGMTMDGPTAQLTYELRYAVEAVDAQGMIPGSKKIGAQPTHPRPSTPKWTPSFSVVGDPRRLRSLQRAGRARWWTSLSAAAREIVDMPVVGNKRTPRPRRRRTASVRRSIAAAVPIWRKGKRSRAKSNDKY
jgi:hypothetical protein